MATSEDGFLKFCSMCVSIFLLLALNNVKHLCGIFQNLTIKKKKPHSLITSYSSNYLTDAILVLQTQEKRKERKQYERNAF